MSYKVKQTIDRHIHEYFGDKEVQTIFKKYEIKEILIKFLKNNEKLIFSTFH